MEHVTIPETTIAASRIGLGTSTMGWMSGDADDERAIQTICAALDRGITLLDTAPSYGHGRAEDIVGRAVQRWGRRDRVVLATKVGLDWTPDGDVVRNASRTRIMKHILDSLRRLRTDYVDVYQVDWPDPLVPFDETAEAFHRLYRDGYIRAIGVSNFSLADMVSFRQVAPIQTAQPPYNVFERQAEQDVLPYCRAEGIATVAYGVLCRGLLSGLVRPGAEFLGHDLPRADPTFHPPHYEQYLAAVAALTQLARDRCGKSVVALAMRWVLDTPGVSIALWEGARPEQLNNFVDDVLGWALDGDTRCAIDQIVHELVTDPVGRAFMAPPARAACAPHARVVDRRSAEQRDLPSRCPSGSGVAGGSRASTAQQQSNRG